MRRDSAVAGEEKKVEDIESLVLDIDQLLAGTFEHIQCPCGAGMNRDVSIVDMDLVREVVLKDNSLEVSLELTEPSCIFGFSIAEQLETEVRRDHPAITEVKVKFVMSDDPIWTEDRLSATSRTRLELVRKTDSLTSLKTGARPN